MPDTPLVLCRPKPYVLLWLGILALTLLISLRWVTGPHIQRQKGVSLCLVLCVFTAVACLGPQLLPLALERPWGGGGCWRHAVARIHHDLWDAYNEEGCVG